MEAITIVTSKMVANFVKNVTVQKSIAIAAHMVVNAAAKMLGPIRIIYGKSKLSLTIEFDKETYRMFRSF